MAKNNLDWDDLGRTIQDAVDRAVSSRDYHQLNQTIRQTVERAADLGGEALRRVVTAQPASGTKTVYPVPRNLYAKTGGRKAWAIVRTALGGVFGAAFLVVLLISQIFTIPVVNAVLAGLGLVGMGGFGWMLASGIRTLGLLDRFGAYRKMLGNRTSYSLEKLARGIGKSVNYVRKDLQTMFRKGYFLEGHLDREQTCLITSDETYRQFEQSRLQLEQRQREEKLQKEQAKQIAQAQAASPAAEVLRRGNAFIDEIRRCNDAIPGEEISAKISRMELIVQRIFERTQAHPEIVPDLKKMMDYYLPMTVKLLNAYADMDAQPIQGETIQASKREIEEALDTLNLAFEKLLDSVFQDTALDVSSDISVLQTMLAQEGLVEDELTKMKKNQNL